MRMICADCLLQLPQSCGDQLRLSAACKVAAIPVHYSPQGPFYIHAVAHTSHAQIQIVVLGKGRQMSAVNLVVQETLSVFTQVQVS